MSKVAVVILNWNGLNYLQKFLGNVISHTPSTLGSVIVADNGSQDGSVEWLQENYPEVGTIVLDRNYGFTGGYNRAFSQIKAHPEIYGTFEYYLLLNSDVEVTSGWLNPLVTFMSNHPKAAVTSPKILSYQKRDYFEYAGACGGLLDRLYFPYCRGRVLSKVEKDNGQYDTPEQVFWASGASFMVRADVWHTLNGLDEIFFAHMEEIDFCWRAKLLGYEVWVTPESKVYHVGGGALPNNSPRKLYLNFRNNLLMMEKNLPKEKRRCLIFLRMCVDGIIAMAYLLIGKIDYFKSVLKAHRDFKKLRTQVEYSKVVTQVPRPKKSIFLLLF